MYKKTSSRVHAVLISEIADAQRMADEARVRWGSRVVEQYGWARPGLPLSIQRKRRISFSDLERASGSDHQRGDYLTGNNAVHAGAYSAINHLNFEYSGAGFFVRSTEQFDGPRIAKICWSAMHYLTTATGMISESISAETEEYDQFLMACEMERFADRVLDGLAEIVQPSDTIDKSHGGA